MQLFITFIALLTPLLFLFYRRRRNPTKTPEQHKKDVEEIVTSLKSRSVQRITLHRGGVSYIARSKPYKTDYPSSVIDVSKFDRVLSFNPERKEVVVEPSITFYDLSAFLTERGFMPLVVPELTGITVGGAIQGLGGESTCFRNGLFDDSCLFFDVALADGTVVRASPDNQSTSSLFYGMRGSFGSLGILLGVGLRVEEATPFVQLTYLSFDSKEKAFDYCWNLMKNPTAEGAPDFIDGVIFSKDHNVVVEGRKVSNWRGNGGNVPFYLPFFFSEWYYRHVERVATPKGYSDVMRVMDYLFRYDRGTFWIASYKIGDTFWKRFVFGAFMASKHLYTLRSKRTDQQTESRGFIQDLMIPYENAVPLLQEVETKLDLYPIWFCPIWNKSPNSQKIFTLCSKSCLKYEATKTREEEKRGYFMNLGVYGDPRVKPYQTVERNKEMERFICDGGGVKVLHACSYYTAEEFAEIYDMEVYGLLRKEFGAENCFPTIFEKVVRKDI